MDEETRKAIEGILKSQRGILTLVHEAKTESAVLQAVAGCLAAEIAMLDKDPQRKLAEIVAGLQGSASAVAEQTNTPHTTLTVDQICSFAEAVMPAGRAG